MLHLTLIVDEKVFCERFNRCDSTFLEKSHQHHRLVDVGHSHSIDEEIFEVREGHLKCLINFHIHRIRTMGEIKRNPKRNNFKNNWRYSIRILCLSLQGLVMNQTTIRNNPTKIKILTYIIPTYSPPSYQLVLSEQPNCL